MRSKIDLESWSRKDHFDFFNKFEEPFYGVNVNIDCTIAYQTAKDKGLSFFLYYLYQSLSASQIIDAFKLRIEGDDVYLYDQIDAGSTIGRPDGTFGFGDFKYHPNFDVFHAEASKVIQCVERQSGLQMSTAENVIRYSALPWIDFTSLSHARMFAFKDSCPKISFGKVSQTNGKRSIPVAIHVHHALVDGLDVGKYIDCFQDLMNRKI